MRIELPKTVDTRAGCWLLIGIGVVTLAPVVTLLFVGKPEELAMSTFLAATTLPQSLLLPLLAKMVGSLVLGVTAIAIAAAFTFAALATGLGERLRDGAGK